MRRLNLIRKLGEHFGYRRRRALLGALLVVCLAGVLVPELPSDARRTYAFVLTAALVISAYSHIGLATGILGVLSALVRPGKRGRQRYAPEGLEGIARAMGVSKLPKVFLLSSPRIGAFTNGVTGTIYLPQSWLTRFPRSEILAILGHEVGHVARRRRFWLEALGVCFVVVLAALGLALRAPVLVAQIFEVALVMFTIPVISWRNERHADMASANALGPEGLISVLEQLSAESPTDHGSETHPPLRDRIERLMKVLEAGRPK